MRRFKNFEANCYFTSIMEYLEFIARWLLIIHQALKNSPRSVYFISGIKNLELSKAGYTRYGEIENCYSTNITGLLFSTDDWINVFTDENGFPRHVFVGKKEYYTREFCSSYLLPLEDHPEVVARAQKLLDTARKKYLDATRQPRYLIKFEI